MLFYSFLEQVQAKTPKERQSEAFINLCLKYKAPRHWLSFALLTPSSIQLENFEITTIINQLSQYPCTISHQGQTVNSLLAFISMGTTEKNKTNDDAFIGKKDKRIEDAIIDAALEKQLSCPIENTGNNPQQKSAIFGLSGNPPTFNHLALIEHLLKNPEYDNIDVILNAQSPLKAKSSYASSEHRYQMLKNMLEEAAVDFKRCHLSRLEIDRAAPSRMVVTLSALILLSAFSQDLTLVLGCDALAFKDEKPALCHWYGWQKLSHLCTLKIYPREGESLCADELLKAFQILKENHFKFHLVFKTLESKDEMLKALLPYLDKEDETRFYVEDIDTNNGSSTIIRDHYQKGKKGVPNGITKTNDSFIRQNQLYQNPTPNLFFAFYHWFLPMFNRLLPKENNHTLTLPAPR